MYVFLIHHIYTWFVMNTVVLSVLQEHILLLTLAWSNLVFLALLFQVCSYCFRMSSCPNYLGDTYIYDIFAVSTRKKTRGVVITSASCGAFLLLALGAMFSYRYHYVRKLKHEVFVDVSGNFSFGIFIFNCHCL